MDIEDIEIGCDGCRTTISKRDDCYCVTCIDKKDEEIRDLEVKIASLESDISFHVSDAETLREDKKNLETLIEISNKRKVNE